MHGGWRWMVGLGALPAGFQFFMLFFLPESRTYRNNVLHLPTILMNIQARILIRRGEMDKAKAVMSKVYALATPAQVSLKVRHAN